APICWVARIALVQIARRRVDEFLRREVWSVAFRASQRVAVRMEWILADPQVQNQAGADAIIVLKEQAAESAAPVGVFVAVLNEPVYSSDHEIGPRIVAIARPTETVIAVLAERIDQVHLHLHQITANRHLVPSLDPVQAVREVEILAIESAGV